MIEERQMGPCKRTSFRSVRLFVKGVNEGDTGTGELRIVQSGRPGQARLTKGEKQTCERVSRPENKNKTNCMNLYYILTRSRASMKPRPCMVSSSSAYEGIIFPQVNMSSSVVFICGGLYVVVDLFIKRGEILFR